MHECSFDSSGVSAADGVDRVRVRVRVLESGAGVDATRLAGLVEVEQDRAASTLFTVTPAEELDDISRWHRLEDAAWCGKVRAVVAAHNRMRGLDRELLSCEVALALNLSAAAASDLVATALLTRSAPGLLEAVWRPGCSPSGTSTRCCGRCRAPG